MSATDKTALTHPLTHSIAPDRVPLDYAGYQSDGGYTGWR